MISVSCARAEKDDPTPGETSQETQPSPPDETVNPPVIGEWNIALISDMNGSYGSKTYSSAVKSAIKHIQDSNVSLVLSTGDMVAGQKTGLDYDGMWSAFHNAVTRPLGEKNLPLLPSPGNHDASTGSSFKKERDLYAATWKTFSIERFNSLKAQRDRIQFLPGVEQNYPLNYAVTMGPAVFIALDATAVGPLVNGQLGWLDEVLTRAAHYPIKIVFGHVPLYPFAFGKASEYLARGTASSGYGAQMEGILEAHKVTYYFSGHSHVFYPGLRNGSTRYISVPLLGSGARKVLTKDRSGSTAKTGFLYLTFNDRGEHSLRAVESPSFASIPFSSTPATVSVPTASATDCSDCGVFPKVFFLDASLRTLFKRINSLH